MGVCYILNNMETKVIDNFLPKKEFNYLKDVVFSNHLPWYFQSEINNNHNQVQDNNFYFAHQLFESQCPEISSNLFNEFKFLQDTLEIKALRRMKLNFYSCTKEIIVHPKHRDYEFKHKGCIISFNTCDGSTILEDDTEIQSIENRALFFDPSKLHSSTTCTNAKARINININYF